MFLLRTMTFSSTLRRSLLIASFLCVLPTAALAFIVPPNDGFVTDTAGVITAEQKAELDASLNAYRTKTSNEIAILLVKNLGGEVIDDVGVQVGRAWGVGAKQKNNGILILASLEDRQVTIQTGYGLEGAVPDVVAKGVIDEDIVPAFRDAKYFEGLVAATEALEKHIGGEYTADRYTSGEDGGFVPFLLFLAFVGLQALSAFLGRTKSWWMGGVIGGVFGVVLAGFFSWWFSIPLLIILGLIFDYIVSHMTHTKRRGRWWGGGFGSGGVGGGIGGGGRRGVGGGEV